MKMSEIVARAMQENSLEEALSFACGMECERAVDQALRNTANNHRNTDGSLWETCFLYVVKCVMREWGKRDDEYGKAIAKILHTLQPEINPCPLPGCRGKTDVRAYQHAAGTPESQLTYQVYCMDCGVAAPYKKSKTEAILHWNKMTFEKTSC